MNQILYKGQIFGGVGEDITNKQHTITLDGQTLETVGGENSEIFNSYKDTNMHSRNISEGKYSAVVGSNNKELNYIFQEGGQYVRPSSSNCRNSFIGGIGNLVLNSDTSLVFGQGNALKNTDSSDQANVVVGVNHSVTNGQYLLVSGSSNRVLGNNPASFVCGASNQLIYNSDGQLIVGGYQNLVFNSYRGIVCGFDNEVRSAQQPVVFGEENKVGDENNPSNTSIWFSGMVSGYQNNVKEISEGSHVLGMKNIVGHTQSCTEGTLVCGNGNTVNNTESAFIGGSGNNALNFHRGILSGLGNRISGKNLIVCGYNNSSSNTDSTSSLIIGQENLSSSLISNSIIGGLKTIAEGSYSNSLILSKNLHSNSINNSFVMVKNTDVSSITDSLLLGALNLGYYIQGLIAQTDSNTKYAITDFESASWEAGYAYDAEHHIYPQGYYVEYWNIIEGKNFDGATIKKISSSVQYFVYTSGRWYSITKEQTSNYNYLGITNTQLENQSEIQTINILTPSSTVSMGDNIPNDSHFQVYDLSTNQFINNQIYSNNTWVEDISGNLSDYVIPIDSSIIIGKNTTVRASATNAIVLGANHSVTQSSNSFIGGYQNTFSSNNIEKGSVILGNKNNFSGGCGGIIIGCNNQIYSSNNNYIFGEDSFVTTFGNTLIGKGLKNTSTPSVLILGKYNKNPNYDGELLVIGNGTDDNNRSNALNIYGDGCQTIILKDKTLSGTTLGIGKIEITQEKIKFTSLKDNSNNEKETVEFTFEDLQSLKNIAPAQNINNTPFPQN